MLETIKIPSFIKDLIKISVSLKILTFIGISGIEGLESIKELIDTNHCVETISKEYKSKNISHSKAKAVHFCSGGITTPNLIKGKKN